MFLILFQNNNFENRLKQNHERQTKPKGIVELPLLLFPHEQENRDTGSKMEEKGAFYIKNKRM